jgi:hypothetical protein
MRATPGAPQTYHGAGRSSEILNLTVRWGSRDAGRTARQPVAKDA